MTTPSILNNDVLIRKYRIDNFIDGQLQYTLGPDGKKYPFDTAFEFPSKYEHDKDNSISVYVNDLLVRINVPAELLVETKTRPRPNPKPTDDYIQYGLFSIPVFEILLAFPEFVTISYDFDSSDPIPQRGLCHALISLKDSSKENYKAQRREWAANVNYLLAKKIALVENDSFRF